MDEKIVGTFFGNGVVSLPECWSCYPPPDSSDETDFLESFFKENGNHYTSYEFFQYLVAKGFDGSITVEYPDRQVKINPHELNSLETENAIYSVGDTRRVRLSGIKYNQSVQQVEFEDRLFEVLKATTAVVVGGLVAKIMGLEGLIVDMLTAIAPDPDIVTAETYTIFNDQVHFYDLYEVYTP